jgi:hypothetical protein
MDGEEGEPLRDVTKSGFIHEHTISDSIGEPEDYRRSAVMATICFCPTGLLSLYHSLLVHQLYKRGDLVGSERASRQAYSYVILTRRVSVFFCIFMLLFLMAGLLLGLCFAIDSRLQ